MLCKGMVEIVSINFSHYQYYIKQKSTKFWICLKELRIERILFLPPTNSLSTIKIKLGKYNRMKYIAQMK